MTGNIFSFKIFETLFSGRKNVSETYVERM